MTRGPREVQIVIVLGNVLSSYLNIFNKISFGKSTIMISQVSIKHNNISVDSVFL